MHKTAKETMSQAPAARPEELVEQDVTAIHGGYGDAGEQVYLAVELKNVSATREPPLRAAKTQGRAR